MSWLQDAQSAAIGSWRLLKRDTGGFDDFDLTESGFWRSFSAIAPIAPMYLYAASIEIVSDDLADQADHQEISLWMAAVALIVQWVAWPLAMAAVARFTGLTQYYTRYIIAYNWSSIIVAAVQMLPILLIAQGGSAAGLGGILYAIALAFVLYYRWYVALTALETTIAVAWALVLGDLVLSFAIARVIG